MYVLRIKITKYECIKPYLNKCEQTVTKMLLFLQQTLIWHINIYHIIYTDGFQQKLIKSQIKVLAKTEKLVLDIGRDMWYDNPRCEAHLRV